MLQGVHSKPLTPGKKEVSGTTAKITTKEENSYQTSSLAQSTSFDQFIRTQPPIKFSGKKSNLKSMQTDKNQKVLLTTQQTTLQTDIDEKNEELRPYIEAEKQRRDKIENGGLLATTMAGAGAGASYGATIDGGTLGGTMGSATIVGGLLGAFHGLIYGSLPTAIVADITNKLMENPELRPLLKVLEDLEQQKATNEGKLAVINADLEPAEKTVQGLKETEAIAKTAVDDKAFKPEHFHHVKNGLESVYQQVVAQGDRVAKICVLIPGFRDTYKRITKDILEGEGVHKGNQALLEKGTDSERGLALKRLYHLEHGAGKFSIPYANYLQNYEQLPELAAAALHILTQNRQLRSANPKEFRKAVEQALATNPNNKSLINAGLDAVSATDIPSGTINYHLQRISSPTSPFSRALQIKAGDALRLRAQKNKYREFDPDAAVDNLMPKMVGNDGIADSLQSAADNYNSAIRNFNHKMPALKLYLNGAAGIGKTSLVQNIHEEFQGDQGAGLIKIHFGPSNGNDINGPIESAEMLVERLRQAAPLQGKTLFFDEFTDLLQLPSEQQRTIGTRLRQLFDIEKIAPGQQHPFKAATGIDPHNVIFAVATNRDLDDVLTDERGNPITDANGNPVLLFNQLGAPAISRIKGGAHEIELQPDLRANIRDFVSAFVPSPYFREIADINWKGHIELTPDAQEHLIKTLTNTAQRNPRERSGRALKDRTAYILSTAISAYKNRLSPTERETRVYEPITIDLGQRDRLAVRL